MGPEEKKKNSNVLPDVSLWTLLSTEDTGFLPTPERPQNSNNLTSLPYFSSLRGLPKLMEALGLEGPEFILSIYCLCFLLVAKETKPQEASFFRAPQGGLFISVPRLSDMGLSSSFHSEDILITSTLPPIKLWWLLMSMALVPKSRWHNMTFRNSWRSSLCSKCFKYHRRKEAGERFDSKVKLLSDDGLCCAQLSLLQL